MGFIGVYRAIYDYTPQSESELAISEGSLLYVLDKEGGDGWWKAKKKATGDDEEEPEGLIPENYIEEVNGLLCAPRNFLMLTAPPSLGKACTSRARPLRVHKTD